MFRILFHTRSARPTIGSRIREAVSNGRIFFRAIIDQNLVFKSKKQLNVSESLGLARSPPSFGQRNDIVKRINSFRTSFFQRLRTRWIYNTFAANLRRRRAKELMYLGGRFPLITFVGLSLIKGPSLLTEVQELEGITWEIRDLFSSVNETAFDTNVSLSPELKSYILGDVLAKGCNAVVYSAHHKSDNQQSAMIEKSVPSMSLLPVGSLAPYDIAVKMMFNYEAESNAAAIWKAMNKEILPAKGGMFGQNISFLTNNNEKNRHLPPHSNIVDMHFAFADRMPLLPEAMSLYPEALPAKLNKHGCGHNMTLFIVMKRYHCTLFEYLQVHKPSFHTSLLLLTQLLEGIVHLIQHQIAHRDLKLDNILIDLSKGLANPQLVITDFGCCLPSSYDLQLPFLTDESFRGGNISLMPPEVISAKPGLFSVIDYTRADLWTAGTLAYDIFGGKNPFYSMYLRSDSYSEEELPPLPDTAPPVIAKLVKEMLQKNFRKRPSPSFAATVCQLLLHLPWLKTCFSDDKKVLEWLVSTAGITMWQIKKNCKDDPIEQQLRATFLSRVQLSEVLQALQYIADE